MKQPNILLIMADQQRADAMGCSGGWISTPNLDRIAAEGVRFTNAVTTSPACVPARMSQITGRYPHNTQVWNNFRHDLEAETPSWWRAVRDAGYRTSLFGKTHLHHHDGDLRDREHLVRAFGMDDIDEIPGPRASVRCLSHMTEGWEKQGLWQQLKDDYQDRFAAGNPARPSVLPLEAYPDVYVGQRAKRYLADYDRDEPWFCHVSFGGPHEPWDAPAAYADKYDPKAMPLPVDSRETLPAEGLDGNIGERLRKTRENNPDGPLAAEIAAKRANYAGNVTLIDDQIGEILDVIERRGEMEHTVIVFTSDHGEMNGDHVLVMKGHFLNGALRVPLLVRTPETAAAKPDRPRVCDAPVEWIDVGPTVTELAGAEIPHRHWARSLVPVIENPDREHRSFALSEISGEVMIMDREWKLIFNREGDPYLLFDQKNDPEEKYNRLGEPQHAGVVEDLRRRLLQRMIATQLDQSRGGAGSLKTEQ